MEPYHFEIKNPQSLLLKTDAMPNAYTSDEESENDDMSVSVVLCIGNHFHIISAGIFYCDVIVEIEIITFEVRICYYDDSFPLSWRG